MWSDSAVAERSSGFARAGFCSRAARRTWRTARTRAPDARCIRWRWRRTARATTCPSGARASASSCSPPAPPGATCSRTCPPSTRWSRSASRPVPLLFSSLLLLSSPPLCAHSVHVHFRSLLGSQVTLSGFCLRLRLRFLVAGARVRVREYPHSSPRRLALMLISGARENSLCCWHDARLFTQFFA